MPCDTSKSYGKLSSMMKKGETPKGSYKVKGKKSKPFEKK